MLSDKESFRIADRIWQLRDARGWSQIQTSREAGISNTTLNTLENGRRAPSLITLRKLARAFDIPVSELLEPTEKT